MPLNANSISSSVGQSLFVGYSGEELMIPDTMVVKNGVLEKNHSCTSGRIHRMSCFLDPGWSLNISGVRIGSSPPVHPGLAV